MSARDDRDALLVEAVRATGRYFDALAEWTERSQLQADVQAIRAGSEPELDARMGEALDAVRAALVALGYRR